MKKIVQLSTIGLAGLLLAACSTTYNQNNMIQRVIRPHKLNNGKTLMVGYKAPDAAWQCKLVRQYSQNYELSKITGITTLAGGYGKLRNQAIAYGNKHHNINYAYLYIPNERHIMGINTTLFKKATSRYYYCQNPPAAHSNPFKDSK